MIDQLKRLFSLRFISILVIILSIAGRMVQKFPVQHVGVDKSFQVQATKNMLEGNGITTKEVFAEDLSTVHHVPLIKWPPGYTFLLAPFYSFSNENNIWGTFWLDLLAAALFVLLARRVLAQFNVATWWLNMYTLVTGFFLYHFSNSESSDLITLVSFQAAILFTLKFFKAGLQSTRYLIAIVLFLFGCCLLRYMYIPLVLGIPAYVLASGLFNRNRIFIRQGAIMMSSLAVLIAGLLIYQKQSGGSAVYLYPIETGVYVDNLRLTFPFIYSSIVNLEPAALVITKATGMDWWDIAYFIIYSHLVVLVVTLFVGIRWMLRRRLKMGGLFEHFACMTLFCTGAVIVLLAYLSVKYAPLNAGYPKPWTYVAEARYYAVPIFMLQLCLFVGAFHLNISKTARRIFNFICLVPLVLSALHGVYFSTKTASRIEKDFFHTGYLSTIDSCRLLFHKFVQDNPGKQLVCATGDRELINYAALWEDIPGLYDFEKVNDPVLKASKPTLVIVAVRDWYAGKLIPFLFRPDKKYIGKIGFWTFYTINAGDP